MIGFAIFGFGLALNEYLKLNRFTSKGIRTIGKRVGITTILGNDRDRIEVPFIEYYHADGRLIKTKVDSNLHNKKESVRIIYDPKNAEKIIIDDWTKNIEWICLTTVGLISVIILMVELASR